MRFWKVGILHGFSMTSLGFPNKAKRIPSYPPPLQYHPPLGNLSTNIPFTLPANPSTSKAPFANSLPPFFALKDHLNSWKFDARLTSTFRWYRWWFRNPAITRWYGKKNHYLQGFIHPRWLFGISSINSMLLSEREGNHTISNHERFNKISNFHPRGIRQAPSVCDAARVRSHKQDWTHPWYWNEASVLAERHIPPPNKNAIALSRFFSSRRCSWPYKRGGGSIVPVGGRLEVGLN